MTAQGRTIRQLLRLIIHASVSENYVVLNLYAGKKEAERCFRMAAEVCSTTMQDFVSIVYKSRCIEFANGSCIFFKSLEFLEREAYRGIKFSELNVNHYVWESPCLSGHSKRAITEIIYAATRNRAGRKMNDD